MIKLTEAMNDVTNDNPVTGSNLVKLLKTIPDVMDYGKVKKLEKLDNSLIGKRVHSGDEYDVFGIVLSIEGNMVDIMDKHGELFTVPFEEIHGTF